MELEKLNDGVRKLYCQLGREIRSRQMSLVVPQGKSPSGKPTSLKTKTSFSGGSIRSSDEVSVMEMERRD